MREILFRGKRKLRNDWIKGYYCRDGKSDMIIVRMYYSDNESLDFWEVIPETVGQYTGLKDKNSNMIFEGDILSIENSKEYFVVVLEDFSWQIKSLNKKCYRYRFENEDNQKYIIVGNIYDNLELLKSNIDKNYLEEVYDRVIKDHYEEYKEIIRKSLEADTVKSSKEFDSFFNDKDVSESFKKLVSQIAESCREYAKKYIKESDFMTDEILKKAQTIKIG